MVTIFSLFLQSIKCFDKKDEEDLGFVITIGSRIEDSVTVNLLSWKTLLKDLSIDHTIIL